MTNFNKKYKVQAVLGSYVDDAFGGDRSYSTARALILFITSSGERYGTLVNVSKTKGPAISMVILGFLYRSDLKICSLAPKKVKKNTEQIAHLLKLRWVTSKDLERMVGRLEFAAWVEPFGRPLLSFLSAYITPTLPQLTRPMTEMMATCLQV